MREVGAFEARNTLSALLDLIEKGEEIIIRRDGRESARLVPPRDAFKRQIAREPLINGYRFVISAKVQQARYRTANRGAIACCRFHPRAECPDR